MSDHGISTEFNPSQSTTAIMASFASIALYNVMELTVIISATFKRKSGLYFWSFVVATWSIPVYTLGFLFKFFAVIDIRVISLVMISIGWCGMITGQSVVLYSRLHLVVQESRILKWVLTMIIMNAFICHIPIIILLFGANSNSPAPYITPYSIYEKIQITIFFLQEFIISGLYIWYTWNALKPGASVLEHDLRSAMKHLIWINAAIVFLDLTLLATEYSGHYEIQTLYKAALYSAKLKMEFRILNQLVSLTKARSPRHWSHEDSTEISCSGGHHLHTFSHRCSKGASVSMNEDALGPDEHGRIRPFSAMPTTMVLSRTTADFERVRRECDPDTDSERERGGSLDITCETTEERLETSWSKVGRAR